MRRLTGLFCNDHLGFSHSFFSSTFSGINEELLNNISCKLWYQTPQANQAWDIVNETGHFGESHHLLTDAHT